MMLLPNNTTKNYELLVQTIKGTLQFNNLINKVIDKFHKFEKNINYDSSNIKYTR